MKNKKILGVLLVVLCVMMFASCDDNNDVYEEKPTVVLFTDNNVLEDRSYNDEIWSSLEDAKKKYDVQIRLCESNGEEEQKAAIKEYAKENAVIVVSGEKYKDFIVNVAKQYPKVQFGFIGSNISGDNINTATFANNESAYLAGVAAGLTTKTKKVAYLYNSKDKLKDSIYYGFKTGVKEHNDENKVVRKYIDIDISSDGLNKVLENLKDSNIDIIYQDTGENGNEIIKLASKKDYYVIGSGRDQSRINSKRVLCSTVQDTGEYFDVLLKNAVKGKVVSDNKYYDLNSEYVFLSDNAGNLDSETELEIKNLSSKIKAKDFFVPRDKESFESFEFQRD